MTGIQHLNQPNRASGSLFHPGALSITFVKLGTYIHSCHEPGYPTP
jgi:hypothetical protein